MIQANKQARTRLSNDLGAISGLLFEIGTGKLVIEENAEVVLDAERKKRETAGKRRHMEVQDDIVQAQAHTQMQYLLCKIGAALGYDAAVAVNDRGRWFGDNQLSQPCIPCLPPLGLEAEITTTIELIDVLWLDKSQHRIVCAFEVEKSTSIYSGILRLSDLSLALPDHRTELCLVVPDSREREVVAQLKRPSFMTPGRSNPTYLLFSDLAQHCEAICRFGADHRVLDKIVKRVYLS